MVKNVMYKCRIWMEVRKEICNIKEESFVNVGSLVRRGWVGF